MPLNDNEISQIADLYLEKQTADLRRSLYSSTVIDPAKRARAMQLAPDLGLPASTVEQDLPNADVMDRFNRIDFKRISKHDQLADFLRNADNAAISQNDTGVLTDLADYARALPGGFIEGIGLGVQGVDSLDKAMRRRWSELFNNSKIAENFFPLDLINPLGRVNQAISKTDAIKTIGKGVRDAGELVNVPVDRRTFGTDVVAGIGQLAGQVAVTLANPVAGTALLYGQGAQQIKDAADKKGASGAAVDYSVIAGALVTGISEKLGLEAMFKRLTPQLKGKVANFLLDVFAHGGVELVQEVAEGLGHNIIQKAGFDPRKEILDGLTYEGGVAFTVGAIFRSMILGGRRMGKALNDQSEEKRSSLFREKLKAIGDRMQASELKKLHRAKFEELLNNLTEKSTVFFPAREITEYFQNSGDGFDGDAFWNAMEVDLENVSDAIANGGDVEVNLSRFVTAMSDSNHYDFLLDEVKQGPHDESYRVARDEQKRSEGFYEQWAEEALQRYASDAEFQTSADNVRDLFLRQQAAAGVPQGQAENYADLVQAFFQTMGHRVGVDPLELYAGRELGVRRQVDQILRKGSIDIDLDGMLNILRGTQAGPTDYAGGNASDFPMLDLIRRMGGVKIGSVLEGELKALGIEPKQYRGLFNDNPNALGDIDNIVADEHDFLEGQQRDDTGIYLDRDTAFDIIRQEAAGSPVLPLEVQARRNEVDSALADLTALLELLGADLDSHSNEEIKQLIDRAREPIFDENGRILEQAVNRGGYNPRDISAGPDGRTNQFEEDLASWRGQIADVRENGADPNGYVTFRESPYVLREMGLHPGRISLKETKLVKVDRKRTKTDNDPVSDTFWDDLPELLADPLAVYPDKRPGYEGNFNVIVDRLSEGKKLPIYVALKAGGKDQAGTATIVLTAFGKNGGWDQIYREMDNVLKDGNKVYFDEGRAPERTREPTSNLSRKPFSKGLARNIISRDDLINRQGRLFFQSEPQNDPGEFGGFAVNGEVTDSDAFKSWAGTDAPVIDPGQINETDFSGPGPYIMRAFHGTTHDFDVFDASINGSKEGQFGAVNYFSSSESDASGNYSGEGPDLTSRIERRAEELAGDVEELSYEARKVVVDEYERQGNEGADTDPELADEIASDTDIEFSRLLKEQYGYDGDVTYDYEGIAKFLARKELSGGNEHLLEVFIRTENPFIVGDGNSPWVEFVDFSALEQKAIERVADDNDLDADSVDEWRDDYQDEIDDARWEIEAETPNELTEAIEKVAYRYDLDPQEIMADILDYTTDGIQHSALEELLRQSEALAYAEDYENGGLIGFHVLAEIIQELGFDSIILKNADQRFERMGIEPGTAHIQVFDANNANIKSVNNAGTFDRADPNIYRQEGKRGAFQPETNIITLFEKADRSTMLHEMGHYFLEVFADLAEGEHATPELKTEWQGILDWMGVSDRSEITTEQHELWARTFEAYLREGKAPSVELEGAFGAFRAWLLRIYQRVAGLDAKINPEIRGIFDRMLATDQEIEVANAQMEIERDLDGLDLTDDERDQLDKAGERASSRAREMMDIRMMRELERERAEVWNADYAKVKAEVEAELWNEPVYRAWHLLSKGTFFDGTAPAWFEGGRLSKSQLVDNYPFADLALLRRTVPPLYQATGGHNPEVIAKAAGFDSGRELVEALINAVPPGKLIKQETDRRMAEKHETLQDPAALAEAAVDAVHNDERTALLELEYSILARKARKTQITSSELIARAADRILAKRTIKQLRPYQFAKAEIRAARAAQKAILEGDLEAAANAKRDQLFNHHMFRKGIELRDEARKKIKAMGKRQRDRIDPKRMPPAYIEAIKKLLRAYQFGSVPSSFDEAANMLGEVRTFMQAQEGEGAQFAVDPSILALPKDHQEMTVAELRALYDAQQSIWKNGRDRSDEKRDQFNAEMDELNLHLLESNKTRKPLGHGRRDLIDSVKGLGRLVAASHRKLTFLFRELDGFVENGPLYQATIAKLQNANDRAAVMQERAWERYREIFDVYKPHELAARWDRKTFTMSNGEEVALSKQDRISIALNWGNPGNRDAVAKNRNWSDGDIQQILDTLDERDIAFVENVWTWIDSYWDEIAALEKRTTGVTPEKVEPEPFQINGRELAGGYFPIKYDTELSIAASRDAATSLADLKAGTWSRAQTRHGFTKERTGPGLGRVAALDLRVIGRHVNEVIHDLAMREAVIDADRVLRHRKIQEAIVAIKGKEQYDLIEGWLKEVAVGPFREPDGFNVLAEWVRTGTTLYALGFSLRTAIQQPLGLTQAIVAMQLSGVQGGNTGYVGAAYSRMITDGRAMFAEINEKSVYMRGRGRTFNRDIYDQVQQLDASRWNRGMKQAAYWFTTGADAMVAFPVWEASYNKALSDGMSEEDAIHFADRIVRDSQGGGSAVDLAPIQQGNSTARMFTLFYTYFSTFYNYYGHMVRQTDFRKPSDYPMFIAQNMLIAVLPGIATAMMGAAGDDDELEEWPKHMALGVVSQSFGGIIGVRDLVSQMAMGFNSSPTPIGRLIATIGNFSRQTAKLADGEFDGVAWTKSAVAATSILLHIPGGAAFNRHVGYLIDYIDGEEKEFDIWEFIFTGQRDD